MCGPKLLLFIVIANCTVHYSNGQFPRQPGTAGTRMSHHPGICCSKVPTVTARTCSAPIKAPTYQHTFFCRPGALSCRQPLSAKASNASPDLRYQIILPRGTHVRTNSSVVWMNCLEKNLIYYVLSLQWQDLKHHQRYHYTNRTGSSE